MEPEEQWDSPALAEQEQLSVFGKPKVFALKYRHTEILHRDTGCLKYTFLKNLYSKQLINLSRV